MEISIGLHRGHLMRQADRVAYVHSAWRLETCHFFFYLEFFKNSFNIWNCITVHFFQFSLLMHFWRVIDTSSITPAILRHARCFDDEHDRQAARQYTGSFTLDLFDRIVNMINHIDQSQSSYQYARDYRNAHMYFVDFWTDKLYFIEYYTLEYFNRI